MEGEVNEQTTLHDAISAQFDAVIPDASTETAPAKVEPQEGETQEQADARARDEKGRFTAKEPAAPQPKSATPTPPKTADAPAAAAAPLTRPSSWKKDYWPIWDKMAQGQALTPEEARKVAEYSLQRENEAARGVSAYKNEWDRARPLVEAYEPHRADFERWGIDPGAQFGRYVEIHKGLALGTPQQKLGTLMQLAQDYKIPVEQMFVQQNGQVFFNPQAVAPQPAPQALNPQAIESVVESVFLRRQATETISSMEKNSEKYPHFESVRNTMGQLVNAGMASPDDLPGAYDMALALPQHRDLIAGQQQQLVQSQEAERKAKQAADAKRAREAAVSPRSATPAGAPVKSQKGLRDTISEKFEEIGAGRM